MLLFGLAWVASFVSSGIGSELSPNGIHAQLDLIRTVSQQSRFIPAEENVTAPRAALGSTPIATVNATTSLTAPLGATAATLLPSWLSSQNGILDFAQPLARWLTAISPIQTGQSSEKETPTAVLDGNFSCLSPTEGISTPASEAASVEENRQYDNFSAWVRACLLADLSDRSKAESLAVRMEESLQAANWEGAKVLPTIAENLPSGQVGDRLLFIVTPEISEDLGHNAEVVATEWVNELRLALGAAPLPLVESQIKMYGLEATGDYLYGEASWYGPYFQGRLTATGEIFDKAMFTAAHKDLPFDTFLKITNHETGNVLIVRINDRGPYVGDRILDLSQGSAEYLGSPEIGVVPVTAEFMEPKTRLQASLPYRAVKSSQDPLITMWRP